jgi:hypothetical protein
MKPEMEERRSGCWSCRSWRTMRVVSEASSSLFMLSGPVGAVYVVIVVDCGLVSYCALWEYMHAFISSDVDCCS